jgi:hypothetical protein
LSARVIRFDTKAPFKARVSWQVFDAERLAAAGSANAGAESAGGDLFGSDSQQGPYPRAPGLPDFARGA